MNRSFLLNLVLLFTVNLVVKPLWLFADLLVQRTTGETYGSYIALLNLSLIFSVFLDLGITNFNNRKIAGLPARYPAYFEGISVLRLLLSVVFMVGLMAFGWLLGYEGNQLKFLLILGVNQVLLSSILYLRSNLTALGFFKWDSFVSVFDRVVMLGLVFYALYGGWIGDFSIEQFIWIQFIGYFLAFVFALLVLFFKAGAVKPIHNWRFSKQILKSSVPYAVVVLLMSAYNYSDTVMVERMLEDGTLQASFYAQSFRILQALNNYAYLFAVLLIPVFAKMIVAKKMIGNLLYSAGGILLYGVLAFAMLTSFWAEDLMALLYGTFEGKINWLDRGIGHPGLTNLTSVLYSASIYKILIWGIVPMAFNYSFGAALTAGGHMKQLNAIAFAALLLNLLLNFILIPVFGPIGAALASVGTQSISALFQMVFCMRVYKISWSTIAWVRWGLSLLFIPILVWFLKPLLPIEFAFWIVLGILFIGGGLIFDFKELKAGFGRSSKAS